MFRKNLLKKISLGVIVFAIFFGVCPNVFAENSPNSAKCNGADSTYNIKITNQMDTGKHRIKLTASEGKFNIMILGDELQDLSKSEEKKFIKNKINDGVANYSWNANKESKFFIDGEDLEIYGEDYAVVVYDTTKDLCKNFYYKVYKVYSSNDESNYAVHTAYVDDINARSDSTPCGWAQNVVNSNNYRDEFKSMVKKAMVGCFPNSDGNVVYNLARSTLKKLKSKLVTYNNIYEEYMKAQEALNGGSGGNGSGSVNQLTFPELGKDWVEIKDPKNFTSDEYKNKLKSDKSNMLTCEAKNEKTYRYLYYQKSTDYKTEYKGVDKNNNKTVCKSTCRESLVVSFGPPTAVIAGQCFTYEAEVKSTVQCVAEFSSGTIPDFAGSDGNGNDGNGNGGNGGNGNGSYIPNEFVPHCNNITGYYDQGGPTEDFDSCVKSCDGGKYSQSCIDKCYTKTYNSDGTPKSSVSSKNSSVSKTSDFDSYKEDVLALTSDGVNPGIVKIADIYNNTRSDVREVYNNVHQYICGYYKNNSYHVGPESSHCGKWANLGYYYFRDLYISTHTYCNIELRENWYEGSLTCGGKNYSKSACSYARNGCYRGVIRSPYIISSDGFKKESTCPDPCEWTKKSPNGGSGNNYYDDRREAESDYVDNVGDYLSKLEGCMQEAQVKCNTDDVSFKMTVTSETKKGENNFDTTKSINKTTLKKDDGTVDKILKFNGGRCVLNGADKDNSYMYHSILTFPGTWINNKSGAVYYDEPANPRWYTSYPGNYCVPLNAKNVNTKWWEWYVGNQSSPFTDKNSLTYNIRTSIGNNNKGFGHYNWNFELGCFYGVSDKTCSGDNCNASTCKGSSCGDDNPQSCTGDGCPPVCSGDNCDNSTSTSGIDKYTTRSYTPEDIFSASGVSNKNSDISASKLSYVDKLDSTTSRAPGFNWSVNATNVSIKGYPITPSSLTKKIEAMGDATKREDELDYDIKLTTSQINRIKNEAKSYNGDFYTAYDTHGFTQVVNGYKDKYLSVNVTTSEGNTYKKYSEGNIPSYSYYRSSWLRSNSSGNYVESNGLPCNNVRNYTSCDYLAVYTRDDNKLASWLSN